jgi:hypothetical protein
MAKQHNSLHAKHKKPNFIRECDNKKSNPHANKKNRKQQQKKNNMPDYSGTVTATSTACIYDGRYNCSCISCMIKRADQARISAHRYW